MKKLFLIAVCAFSALTMSAQRASSSSSSFFSTEKSSESVRFGIRAGLNFATMTGDDVDDVDSRTAFHVGVIADIPLLKSLYIQSGVYLTQKGLKYNDELDNDIDGEVTAKPMYLEIPVLASYRYNFSDATQLQFNVGPYFAFGLGGKVKAEASYENVSASEEVDFFGDDDDQLGGKRFDCGLQVGLGLTFAKHIYVGGAYEFGFTDAIKDTKAKNSNWMVSVGYTF